MEVLILQGPNLNLLGEREPKVYGTKTLDALHKELEEVASSLGITLRCFQSNHEGALVDTLQQARNDYQVVILNAGALCHYSYALRDAIASISLPVINVHISNTPAREDFRRVCVLSPVCYGQITGFGTYSYYLALYAAKELIKEHPHGYRRP